jgi:hypothetical protein
VGVGRWTYATEMRETTRLRIVANGKEAKQGPLK